MEAFEKNIDALEQKIGLLIQKWNRTLEENNKLTERNKKLEESLRLKVSEKVETQYSAADTESDNALKLHKIESALDNYIKRIDSCLELINNELNGGG